jgi:hypothetical protein
MSSRNALFLGVVVIFIIAGCDSRHVAQTAQRASQDCIIENARDSRSDTGAALVAASCADKYTSNELLPEVASKPELVVCNMYWDGWQLKKGERPSGDQYGTVRIDRYGAEAMRLHLPKNMIEYFNVGGRGFDKEFSNWSLEFKEFWEQNFIIIQASCLS